MGEQRSRIGTDHAGDASARPTVPAPSGRYLIAADHERERETIPPSAEHALTDDERLKKAQFEAIKLLRRTLSGG
jgi:hypothetical protein